jgi:hypothetical protein
MRSPERRRRGPRLPGSGVTSRAAEKRRLAAEAARKQRDEEAIKFARACLEPYVGWLKGKEDAERAEQKPAGVAGTTHTLVGLLMTPPGPEPLLKEYDDEDYLASWLEAYNDWSKAYIDWWEKCTDDEWNRYTALMYIREVLHIVDTKKLKSARDLVAALPYEVLFPGIVSPSKDFLVVLLRGFQEAIEAASRLGPGRPKSTAARNDVIAETVGFIVYIYGFTPRRACGIVQETLQSLGFFGLTRETIQTEIYASSRRAKFVRETLDKVRANLSVDTFGDEQKVWVREHYFGLEHESEFGPRCNTRWRPSN